MIGLDTQSWLFKCVYVDVVGKKDEILLWARCTSHPHRDTQRFTAVCHNNVTSSLRS